VIERLQTKVRRRERAPNSDEAGGEFASTPYLVSPAPDYLRSARLVEDCAWPWKWPGVVCEWLTVAVAPFEVAVAEPEADAPAPTVTRSTVACAAPPTVVALLDAVALAEAASAIGDDAMSAKAAETGRINLCIGSSLSFLV